MSNIDLHIVSFDVPYPADYGGVIDVFFKLKALSSLGCKVHLHCFEYGRGRAKELEKYSEEVSYYKRNSFRGVLSTLPYIVKSRENNQLLSALLGNNAPILFEGIHCCSFLNHKSLENRLKIVRTHNIEHSYYKELARNENTFIKRLYYSIEAKRLKKFEKQLTYADHLLAISEQDEKYLKTKFKKASFFPAFHGFVKSEDAVELDEYFFYHGNLSVAENNQAANFLIEVFKSSSQQLIIAGKEPKSDLAERIKEIDNVKLVPNPDSLEMDKLLKAAKVVCLPAFQSTGVKLKLIHSMMMRKKLIANQLIIEGSGLENGVLIANNKEEWQKAIELSIDKFPAPDPKKIDALFNNKANAKKLLELFVQAPK